VDKTAERRLRTPQEEISVCLPRWHRSSKLWCRLGSTDLTLPCWTYIFWSQLSRLIGIVWSNNCCVSVVRSKTLNDLINTLS
jgi:hypothetical protein